MEEIMHVHGKTNFSLGLKGYGRFIGQLDNQEYLY
jgi:hypothetical protein